MLSLVLGGRDSRMRDRYDERRPTPMIGRHFHEDCWTATAHPDLFNVSLSHWRRFSRSPLSPCKNRSVSATNTRTTIRSSAAKITGDALAGVYEAHVALHVSELTECRITADELAGYALTGMNGAHVLVHISTFSERRMTAEILAGDSLASV